MTMIPAPGTRRFAWGGSRSPLSARLRDLAGRFAHVLPRGRLLPDEVWRRRHQIITRLGLAHAPVIVAFGTWTGHGVVHSASEAGVVAIFALAASQRRLGRLLQSVAACLSLLTASAILVHLSSGAIEMHFHFFVVVPLLALYQDWIPFLLSIGYVVVHHVAVGFLDPGSVFNHPAGQANPLLWALIHGGFIAALSIVSLVAWSASQRAFSDSLTNLASRGLFKNRLEDALARATAEGMTPAVLFIDIDDFKTVNDSLGHTAGDELLTAVGQRIRRSLRAADTAARMGGDEFAVLIEDGDVAEATMLAERLLRILRAPFTIEGQTLAVRISIGIACAGSATSPSDLLRNADTAMYVAKTGGKDRYALFESTMHEAALRRFRLKADLERAVERDELTIDYQPVVDLTLGVTTGVEALMRWRHPEQGMISPVEFIPLAEETGLIVEMGRRILERACLQAAEWQALVPGLTMSVNLSVRQLTCPELVADVAAALRHSGLPPDRLVLEITESVLMEDVERSVRSLELLKSIGIRLAIDDFGTGHSSLSYLRQLPVDILKIDRSFVSELGGASDRHTIAGVVVSLGRSLGLRTVAEGVEEPGQLSALRAAGCDDAQGFLLSRPAPAERIAQLLTAGLDPATTEGFEPAA
jgi:diguanylate cyclase (GGDEF)-like protein